tara:strand:+ start:300 stop:1037 length:738 start_codon:yes stop_codon:yes gene_type:complete
MISSKIIVDRNKSILQVCKQKYNYEKNMISRYERQINYYKDELCKKELIIQTNIEKVENIMIVAHADDETIFGSKELHNGKWLLIICTNSMDGRVGLTRKDIPGLIQMSKDYNFNLIIIQHWDIYENIINTRFDITVYSYLEKYLMKQSWDSIITHNRDGEYGHAQHILVHRMVSNILYNNDIIYKTFKVFDFSDEVSNDHLIVKKIINKYYLLKGDNLLDLKCDKVCTKDEVPVDYDMRHVLSI